MQNWKVELTLNLLFYGRKGITVLKDFENYRSGLIISLAKTPGCDFQQTEDFYHAKSI